MRESMRISTHGGDGGLRMRPCTRGVVDFWVPGVGPTLQIFNVDGGNIT